MGADVEWDSETQTATATLDNTVVTFSIDNINAEVNKTSATMDARKTYKRKNNGTFAFPFGKYGIQCRLGRR